MKIKVFHIITGLSIAGAEQSLHNVLRGGLNNDYDNHVVSLIDEGTIWAQIKALGVPVTVLGMHSGRPSIKSLRKLNKVVHEFQFCCWPLL